MVPSRIQIKMAASEFTFPDMRLEVQKPLSADRRVSSDANRGKRKERDALRVLRSGAVGPLFGRFGPLRAQKGVQRLENEHFVVQVLLDPFLEDLDL